ncbi:Glutathione import ATP-binding protein GsiA [uncultured Clostridium sp.]|uniref:ABC transporter ATP-binding protein n=1 Tax=Enterocloster citroniae TaxID=358743 RepID=UPI000820483F|nr:ABC transporter ATP-binding protein [Enterocloster citroniae]SCI11632.1 Glutathione import ATP-binding protein GsiA [uncultured Clostridium sp.]
MGNHLLEIENLQVQYNTDEAVVHAVNGLTLTLDKGEALGVVGETGAGKSTTALSILKLLPAKVGEITGGKIHYDGIDILKADNNAMRRIRGARIAMIFQDPMSSLNPIMTIGEQIHEVLELHFPQMSAEERNHKVDEILGLVGIQKGRKNEYPHQFSGGMKQRIGIAMALVAEPELLLADEPTTALDVTIQAQILQLMQELQKKYNTAMILITHDLGVVAEFCEKVVVVYAGEVIEQGTVEDIFTREMNHPYTVGLFNSIPDLTSKVERLVPIPGFMSDPTNLPKGCKFAERCSQCTERCRSEAPGSYTAGTHSIRCFLYERSDKGGES